MDFIKKERETTKEPGKKAGDAQPENTLDTVKDPSPAPESVKRNAIFRKLKKIGYKTGEIKMIFGKRKKSSTKVHKKSRKNEF
jgi:hypothetical protein